MYISFQMILASELRELWYQSTVYNTRFVSDEVLPLDISSSGSKISFCSVIVIVSFFKFESSFLHPYLSIRRITTR